MQLRTTHPEQSQSHDYRSAGPRHDTRGAARGGFTLIELLVVISIISMLISILMPSLSRARAQAKSIHCLARLKEFGNGLATYENANAGSLPPALWYPDEKEFDPNNPFGRSVSNLERPVAYGWAEILFSYVYSEEVGIATDFPVQRNIESRRWEKYFICQSVGDDGVNSGHYRVYLPAWSGTYNLRPDGVYDDTVRSNPMVTARRERIRPKLPLIGDANDRSERGDALGDDDCSYIDAGEANYAGFDGATNGNRFSDRHYGGTNYLFQDLHGAWNSKLREELARDYDLNGKIDIVEAP